MMKRFFISADASNFILKAFVVLTFSMLVAAYVYENAKLAADALDTCIAEPAEPLK